MKIQFIEMNIMKTSLRKILGLIMWKVIGKRIEISTVMVKAIDCDVVQGPWSAIGIGKGTVEEGQWTDAAETRQGTEMIEWNDIGREPEVGNESI